MRYENGPANFEQSCAIKFCVKLCESATVTYEKLQWLVENIPYPGHKCSDGTSLLEGREQVEDEPRAGRPSTSKNRRQCGKSEVSCEVRSSIDVENDQ